MFTKKLLSLLLLVPNNLKDVLLGDFDSIYIRFKDINSGNDERFDIITNGNFHNDNNDFNTLHNNTNITVLYMLDKIRTNIINKNIIEELENNNTNIQNKLNIIEKYTNIYKNQNRISEFNLLSGNLLKDFYDI
jgi:hypothetical protein